MINRPTDDCCRQGKANQNESPLSCDTADQSSKTLKVCYAAFSIAPNKAVTAIDGIDDVRLHDLRHTCASLAISGGANVKVVQKLLGHKTAVLTLDRYGHLFSDDLDAVADAFDTAADALRMVTAVKAVALARNSL